MLYSFGSVAVVIVLFILMVAFNEFAYRMGEYIQKTTPSETKTLTGSVQASVLGLLALLLGFTFSMSMQRYDDRSEALISEVSAIESVILHSRVLPEERQLPIIRLLSEYTKQRLEMSEVNLTERDAREAYSTRVERLQEDLWALAIEATRDDSRPMTTGNFNNALIRMFELQEKRNALLQLHVPEVVLFLLFLAFISAGGILGYSAGLSGSRILAPTILVSLLISLIVFIIIDLDRPRRGIIQIDQSMLQDLSKRVTSRYADASGHTL